MKILIHGVRFGEPIPLFAANPLRSDLHDFRSSFGQTGTCSITFGPHNITTQRNNAVG